MDSLTRRTLVGITLLLSCSYHGVDSFAPTFAARHSCCRRNQPTFSSLTSTIDPATFGHAEMNTSRRYSEDRQMPAQPFERRMRDLVQGKPRKKAASRANPMRPPNVQEVLTLEEYKKAVADVDDKLVVVRFYAKWCKACRAVAPYFYKMAREYEDVAVFVELPVTEHNANVHQGLGVPTIPFGHIYHPQGGLVEERRMVRKAFPRFLQVFRTYANGSCDLLGDGVCSNPYADEPTAADNKKHQAA